MRYVLLRYDKIEHINMMPRSKYYNDFSTFYAITWISCKEFDNLNEAIDAMPKANRYLYRIYDKQLKKII